MGRFDTTVRDHLGRKRCPSCTRWKAEAEFAANKATRDGLQSLCRRCRADRYRQNAERVRDSMREAKFGLSRIDFDAMLQRQGGRCAVCGTTDPGSTFWAVDHDHACCPSRKTCGKCVRGILCRSCNQGLGNFADDVDRLTSAVAYLNRTSRRIVR